MPGKDYEHELKELHENVLEIAKAINGNFSSPNVADSNFEKANVVDVLDHIGTGVCRLAHAIYPKETMPGHDETGGTVMSLTEAVMGVTGGLCRIANAISELAQAVENHGSK